MPTNNKLPSVQQIADIAMESEITDPIDWTGLHISERAAYEMMANHAMEVYVTNAEFRDAILLSTITKLMVENFVLNLKLQSQK